MPKKISVQNVLCLYSRNREKFFYGCLLQKDGGKNAIKHIGAASADIFGIKLT